MACTFNTFMAKDSSFASKEIKERTMDAIRASGTVGLTPKEIQKANGLDRTSHAKLMRQLNDYGAIRRIGTRSNGKTADPLWGAMI